MRPTSQHGGWFPRAQASIWEDGRPLDPIEILNRAADESIRDCAYWITISAAAYLNGYDLKDGNPSTVATYFPGPWSLDR